MDSFSDFVELDPNFDADCKGELKSLVDTVKDPMQWGIDLVAANNYFTVLWRIEPPRVTVTEMHVRPELLEQLTPLLGMTLITAAREEGMGLRLMNPPMYVLGVFMKVLDVCINEQTKGIVLEGSLEKLKKVYPSKVGLHGVTRIGELGVSMTLQPST